MTKNKKAIDITQFDFKVYCKIIVIKTAWCWHKYGHKPTEQNKEPRSKRHKSIPYSFSAEVLKYIAKGLSVIDGAEKFH